MRLGRAAEVWRQGADPVAGPDDPVVEDTGIHPRVFRVEQDRDAAGLPAGERALDDVARIRGSGNLEDEVSADREARSDRQPRELDASGRQVLADRAGLDARMSVSLNPLDRLDGEERDRPMRPAVDGVVVM